LVLLGLTRFFFSAKVANIKKRPREASKQIRQFNQALTFDLEMVLITLTLLQLLLQDEAEDESLHVTPEI
jgi:hypothetical protein